MANKVRLLEPKDAKIGVLFLDTLAYLRLTDDHPQAAEIGSDFNQNKKVVAQMIPNCSRYGDLPKDAKSFVSRCAATKRTQKHKSMGNIVLEQYQLVQYHSDMLYKQVMEMLDRAVRVTEWKHLHAMAIAEWYEQAAENPLHAYHPEEIPDECFHSEMV